jgi:hypothetical protein
MTVPPKEPHEPRKRVGVTVEEPESVAVPIEVDAVFDIQRMDWLGDDERDAVVRGTVLRLNPVLHEGPRPLSLVLDVLEYEFDLRPGCAERLFWLAQERGYLSLREGNVYLGRLRATV